MARISTTVCMLLALLAGGCATIGGETPAEERQSILAMKNEVLTDLYKVRPKVKSKIAGAPGYAVFSNANVNVMLASFGGGYGVVRNNGSGKCTYMKMGEVGVGLGLGAQADAAAKVEDKGAAVGGEITVDNMTISQLTETGLALQATIKGTKYWKDEALN